ncbi:MAG TPA: hypothetical protein VEF72_17945 [Mycobacterium sp.]|nr:hypothetical protein [Mycobacterium sp.]
MTDKPIRRVTEGLPVWRIGLTGGLVGMMCCVGATARALNRNHKRDNSNRVVE